MHHSLFNNALLVTMCVAGIVLYRVSIVMTESNLFWSERVFFLALLLLTINFTLFRYLFFIQSLYIVFFSVIILYALCTTKPPLLCKWDLNTNPVQYISVVSGNTLHSWYFTVSFKIMHQHFFNVYSYKW